MISDLNQLPASKGNLDRPWVMLCFILVVVGLLGIPTINAAVRPPAPILRTSAGFQPNMKEAEWILEDSLWLARQLPDVGKHFPEGVMDQDSLSLWMNWAKKSAVATSDSMPIARSVSSLLRDRWLQRGYFSTIIESRAGAIEKDIQRSHPDTLVLNPGTAYRLGKLEISGNDFSSREHLLKTWLPRPEELFIPAEFDAGINLVLAGAGDAGFPFARWATSKLALDPVTSTLDIKASLLPGTKSYIGPLTCDLPEGRGQNFLLKASGLAYGKPFRNSDLQRARQRLLARDLYTQVDMPQVYTTTAKDTVGVHFHVKPILRNNHLQVVLGLSRPSDGSGAKVSGEVDLRLPNMAGTGRALQVGWRDDGVRKSRFGVSYLEPLALGTPLDTEIFLNQEVDQESFTLFKVDNRWRLQVVNLWGVELGAGWDRSTYPQGVWVSSNRTRARGAFFHRRGDRTSSGWSGLFAIENAWRSSVARLDDEEAQEASSTGTRLGESETQQIFEVDSEGEFFLGSSWSLFARSSFRELSGAEGEVPLSEQFQFGGAATLRGFREDEFHGSRAAWGSIEMRLGRPGGSRLYFFYDLGYFAYSAADPFSSDLNERILKEGWPKGFGLGILAKTPGGDISLAIGFPGSVDFDLAKLHVTLLESF